MQSVTQQINTQLVTLKLSGIRDALSQQSEQPNLYVEQSFEERLCLLLDHEITQRYQRKIERLTRQAKFRVNGTLAQLDYGASRQLNKTQIRSLAQGEWLRLHQNILITGATGCGKTYLACALGHNHCQQGENVYYFRLKELLEKMFMTIDVRVGDSENNRRLTLKFPFGNSQD